MHIISNGLIGYFPRQAAAFYETKAFSVVGPFRKWWMVMVDKIVRVLRKHLYYCDCPL